MYIFLILLSIFNFFFLSYYRKYCLDNDLVDNKNLDYGYQPTPTGSGIIILILFLFSNIFYFFYLKENFTDILPNRFYVFYFSIFLLSTISFIDDFKPISPILRLLLQISLVYFSLSLLELDLFFSLLELNDLNIPLKLRFFIIVCVWIYILNITNFIDGCDGFLSSILIFFFLGVIFSFNYYKIEFDFSYYTSLSCLFLLFGFFILNKPIAKIYMGDAGSIFFGYAVGFIFIDLSIRLDLWNVMLGLFSYPIVDCSKAIFIKTVIKKHYPWARLSDYSFLKPIINNKSNHTNIFRIIFLYSIVNFIIVLIGIIFSLKSLIILNYIIALLLVKIFDKNDDFRIDNLLKLKIF